MKILLKLKKLLKEAVKSGKIYYTGKKLNQHFDYEFTGFLHMLNSKEWKSFEDKEKQFRAEMFLRCFLAIIPSVLYFYIKLSSFLCLGSRAEREILLLSKYFQ